MPRAHVSAALQVAKPSAAPPQWQVAASQNQLPFSHQPKRRPTAARALRESKTDHEEETSQGN
jgi:hypothetical protein